ncbi:MAG: hypothetical protein LC779_16140 [Actinobacteria bacterium]|nr:hypothetical protein [Actinomycetota bacterium]
MSRRSAFWLAVAVGLGAVLAPSAEDEQPLPTWVRMAIVGAALLAFLAVSLIATRNG